LSDLQREAGGGRGERKQFRPKKAKLKMEKQKTNKETNKLRCSNFFNFMAACPKEEDIIYQTLS